MAWLALLGMLFQVAFAFGHIDGHAHAEGLLVASLERLAGHGEEPESGHQNTRPHGHCGICIVSSMGAALPAGPADHSLFALAFQTIDWTPTAPRPHTPDPASHHEIRGPPRA